MPAKFVLSFGHGKLFFRIRTPELEPLNFFLVSEPLSKTMRVVFRSVLVFFLCYVAYPIYSNMFLGIAITASLYFLVFILEFRSWLNLLYAPLTVFIAIATFAIILVTKTFVTFLALIVSDFSAFWASVVYYFPYFVGLIFCVGYYFQENSEPQFN